MPSQGMRHPRCIAKLHAIIGPSFADAGTDCLQKSGYKEEKCQRQIDALYECCNAFYQRNGDDASCVSCPKANLLRLKIKQRSEGK
ncbi:tRNA-dihydrouridine synthase [Botryosphaeria dothidea]|uniref:Cx9C motif-containing protein 4, mitochondrial n=1 Tax=Botryosphaeria dothidea TaxID=55169 RepID=A0A8H4II80_9PEZI|nr:tRNA-dihydrouridine synthase [Botryosphaeria dothidea]KAF4305258.1 tRNA-dihydrouridine synthase [Botryosphaeria dothidea]